MEFLFSSQIVSTVSFVLFLISIFVFSANKLTKNRLSFLLTVIILIHLNIHVFSHIAPYDYGPSSEYFY